MSTLLVHGGDVYTPYEVIHDGAVLARDSVIEWVGRRDEVRARADREVNAAGGIICPGFVDLQVNGGGGALLTDDATVDAVERMARAHVRFGTTAFLPTVVTAPERQMLRALGAVAAAMQRPPVGARVWGAHLEGPFIHPERRGAHDPRFIREPDRDLLERFVDAAALPSGQSALTLITLAPELPGALGVIARAVASGIVVSIGHTNATYDEAYAGIHAGARVATHLFNGMGALHHRQPGAVGAALNDERVVATVIADGVHVHLTVLRLVARAKGAGGVALVTDAMSAAGTHMPSFPVGGREVIVRDGACYLPDGTLAGSALTMDAAVRNMAGSGVSLRESIEMATATPAGVLRLRNQIGVLEPGARADLVVLDRERQVRRVFVGGEEAHRAG